MTSPSDVWSSNTVSLTCGARSTVNIDRSTVNSGRVQLGRLGWIRVGLWLATWQAVALPCRSRGPQLGCGPCLVVHGGPGDASPWTADRTTVDQVHPLFSQARSTYTGCTRGWPTRGVFPDFLLACPRRRRDHRRAPAIVQASN
jgi:hypothetical protein